MLVDFYGLSFETPRITAYLWSPWRASSLEHRLYEALHHLPHIQAEELPDEKQLHIREPKTWRTAVQALERVLKGWQEDADPGTERRSWCWLIEGDTDADGYDHAGEPISLWILLRASVDRGGPGEAEKGEDVDLEGFGLRITGENGGR